jgi:uncharacterized membrane protein YjfL (UPF0719 family)
MPDMINPQKGIDIMNNDSIINRILFAVTIFQHSPLTRRVFYNIIRERERAATSTTSGTLTGISINHRKFFSSSISSSTTRSWNGIIIICINMD